MAGIVYLRTNRFEVKLEGITFKAKDFETLCAIDFLFPNGKVWDHPPVVGLDVMRHPRDPSILLVLLCFGVGCVILKFQAGESLPASIQRFLSDKRIHFVGFGIPEKKDLFPFEELGLTRSEVDIGYLAAKILKDSKYKRCELAELARKVLGIKRMVGLTEASSFERHEQIKCAICQLFITSVIAMGLVGANGKKKTDESPSPKKGSFLKNLNLLPLLAEGWFKLPKVKKTTQKAEFKEGCDDMIFQKGEIEDTFSCSCSVIVQPENKDDPFEDYIIDTKTREGDMEDAWFHTNVQSNSADNNFDSIASDKDKCGISSDDSSREISFTSGKPLKSILKLPSSNNLLLNYTNPSSPASPLSISKGQVAAKSVLKRANSKGCNVSFTR
ncbi:uncharacterized protein LOC142540577 isoform X1 [Primulina tabacum]|uniref:uncharacterized protein LOC142540577 isoform X1 n=2 Tax=Primulina tabacum TaxID=48773 RepID=UPI003F5A214C